MKKLKHSEIAGLRKKLQEMQDNKCAVCGCDFKEGYYHHGSKKVVPKHQAALDHDHRTGQVRDVLCSGCNSLEGKMINAIKRYHTSVAADDHHNVARLLYGLAQYTAHHEIDRHQLIHPQYKTTEEKREWRNRKARIKRRRDKQA